MFIKMRHIINHNGRLCLVQNRTKTGTERFYPLDSKSLAIIEKYKQLGSLPKYANKTINIHLKVIQAYCGIKTSLHTHLGRHTFAHHCLNTKFVSMEATAVAMGCLVSNVKKYASVSRDLAMHEFQ